MESLLNFNFLKDISVKKNNEKNANDKSLVGDGKSIEINQPDSIENEFNNILSDQESNENSLALEKQKSKKSKEKLNIESTELSLADISIKTSENHSDSNLGNISIKNKKGKTSLLNITKDGSLNIHSHNNEEKVLNNNIKKASNQKIIIDSLDNNEFNKPLSNFTNLKKSKISLYPQTILNTGKKSKIRSFFQNYINYTSKKYSKKNIILKKSQLENLKNYDRKSYKESSTIISNNNINTHDKNNTLKDQKSDINFEINTKELNKLSESNIKHSIEKNINNTKENSFDNFDRLKNILDIRSNDIKQRFSQILENNIKMNNNKFEIQLRPENLGKIHVTIEITGQNVDININSDNVNSIQSLTENNSNLQKMLQNNGMNLNNFNFNGNNNKGSNKDSKDNEVVKNNNISVNKKDNNNDDDSFMSDKLVYAKA
ncbi:flagellar hook-length control protein FliK [Alphaproteobacteria bacterium]|nr:flagellar hook-length control protein FliK [Alphaproteobacteria bacterium]